VNSGISKPVQAESGGEPDAEEHSGPIDKHLGKRVRMRRLMLRMSQTELGEALDLTFQQVQKYEKGENRIGASRLQHISEVLGVPYSSSKGHHITADSKTRKRLPCPRSQ
jgi:transcriptional regulator with XRE-family HTH domain